MAAVWIRGGGQFPAERTIVTDCKPDIQNHSVTMDRSFGMGFGFRAKLRQADLRPRSARSSLHCGRASACLRQCSRCAADGRIKNAECSCRQRPKRLLSGTQSGYTRAERHCSNRGGEPSNAPQFRWLVHFSQTVNRRNTVIAIVL